MSTPTEDGVHLLDIMSDMVKSREAEIRILTEALSIQSKSWQGEIRERTSQIEHWKKAYEDCKYAAGEHENQRGFWYDSNERSKQELAEVKAQRDMLMKTIIVFIADSAAGFVDIPIEKFHEVPDDTTLTYRDDHEKRIRHFWAKKVAS